MPISQTYKLKTHFSQYSTPAKKVVPNIFERWSSNRVIEPNVQGGSDFQWFQHHVQQVSLSFEYQAWPKYILSFEIDCRSISQFKVPRGHLLGNIEYERSGAKLDIIVLSRTSKIGHTMPHLGCLGHDICPISDVPSRMSKMGRPGNIREGTSWPYKGAFHSFPLTVQCCQGRKLIILFIVAYIIVYIQYMYCCIRHIN